MTQSCFQSLSPMPTGGGAGCGDKQPRHERKRTMKTNQTNTDWTVGFAPLGSPSPRPSPLGRGRTVHRLWITSVAEFAQQLLAEHPSEARCSLSLRERVRVRGKYSVADAECSISQKLL